MNERDIFIMNLKNLMREYKLNNTTLGKKLGVSQQCVCVTINKKSNVSMPFALKVCEVFGVTMAQMFTPDERQFEMKHNTAEENKDELIEHLRKELTIANDQIDNLAESNALLQKENDLYRFGEDSKDGKVKLISKHGVLVLSKDGTDIPLHNDYLSKNHDFKITCGCPSTAEVTVYIDEIDIKF